MTETGAGLPVGRRALLKRLLLALGLTAMGLPGRFWRVVHKRNGAAAVGRSEPGRADARHARPFDADELDRPHDLAG